MGFECEGFDVEWAADWDDGAIETYRRNLGDAVSKIDLAGDVEIAAVSVVAGGPPCQGFSSAGMRREGDGRNSLVSRFANQVLKLRPPAFVFENVEGFLTAGEGRHVFELLEPLVAGGYRIHLRKVNAANYGVPQHRKRVLAIGGLGWDPTFPAPTHSAFGAPGARLASRRLPATQTLDDALSGLPRASAGPPGVVQGHL